MQLHKPSGLQVSGQGGAGSSSSPAASRILSSAVQPGGVWSVHSGPDPQMMPLGQGNVGEGPSIYRAVSLSVWVESGAAITAA